MRRLYVLSMILLLVVATAACKKTETYNNETTTGASSTDTYASTTTGAMGESGMTGATGAMTLNDKDKDFVTTAGKGGKAEVELANDALTHATNADVKSFAQKLVDDHSKANSELEQF